MARTKKRGEGKTVPGTLSVGLRTYDDAPDPLDQLHARILREVVTQQGVAVQWMLERMLERSVFEADDEGNLVSVDLFIPVTLDREQRARELIAQERKDAPLNAGPKEAARPRYHNGYRMEEIVQRNGERNVRCRLAERFSWVPERGPLRGKRQHDIDIIDATKGLQGLLKTWMPPEWSSVPSALRAGVCQQAAQQFNSHVGLLGKGEKASFPSLQERNPVQRQDHWHQALRNLVQGETPFEYVRLRDLQPDKYADDDPKGDREVNTDPDWVTFVCSPFPARQTLNFVKSNDVIVCRGPEREDYNRRRGKRRQRKQRKGQQIPCFYAALPIVAGVELETPLGRIIEEHQEELGWWKDLTSEFEPLPAWSGSKISRRRDLLLVPIETRNPAWIERMLSGHHGRRVCWSLLVERRGTCQGKNKAKWELRIATSRNVLPLLRPNVLGIHFGMEPILWWTLMDGTGSMLEEGRIERNEILTEGLAKQLRLHEVQGQQRWVGGKRFEAELKRRTDDVARTIVLLAASKNANLALENIQWVDKRHGGRDANRRHSMWNFSKLKDRIVWMGLERQRDDQNDPVVTVKEVSDYVLRYTCPGCGGCRSAGQTQAVATTWREGDTLHCRPCGYTGHIPDNHQATLVAHRGVEDLVRRRREAQRDAEGEGE